MKTVKLKTVRNFVVANLCAFVPLWWMAFGWMPDQVKIFVTGTGEIPCSITTGETTLLGEDYGVSHGQRIWRFYLCQGMEWKNLVFGLPNGVGAEAVDRVELQKWKLVSLGKTGRCLIKNAGDSHNHFHFSDSRFEKAGFVSPKIALALLFGELLLFALAYGFARFHRPIRRKQLLPSAFGVALVLVLLMQVALPIQTYVANRSSFPFSPLELSGAIAGRLVVAVPAAVLAVFLLARCFGRWVFAPIFAYSICVYLESGVLSIGQPSLNGDWWFFRNSTRIVWDSVTWAGVFAGISAAHRFLKNHYGAASLCLLVLVGASMLDVRQEEEADQSKLIVTDFSSIETVDRSVTYSTNRNVMVFVIDSLEREQAHAVMEDPEAGNRLREQFRGFTEYLDNVGTGEGSLAAVANLFTGKYPEDAALRGDYYASVFSKDSAVRDYLEEGHAVYVSTPALGYGYTNRRVFEKRRDRTKDVFRQPIDGGLAWTLETIDRFRWFPFVLKLKYILLSEQGLEQKDDLEREWNLYPILREAGLAPANIPVFMFMHSDGVHAPVLYNRHLELMPGKQDSDEGCIEMGVGVLGLLGQLFDTYRERGLYDNSLILVLADHGNYSADRPDREGFPNHAKPFLWVKPIGSRHDFATSLVPTSHARVSTLLKESSRRVLSEDEIQQMLQAEKRLYRKAVGEKRSDWIVGGNGTVQYEEGTLSIPSPESMRPLPTGRVLSLALKGTRGNGDLDIYFTNVNFVHLTAFGNPDEVTTMSFRVPNAQKSYELRLLLKVKASDVPDGDGACIRFRQKDRSAEWMTIPANDYQVEAVFPVIPDQSGMVTIEGELSPEVHSFVYFTHLKVAEARP